MSESRASGKASIVGKFARYSEVCAAEYFDCYTNQNGGIKYLLFRFKITLMKLLQPIQALPQLILLAKPSKTVI